MFITELEMVIIIIKKNPTFILINQNMADTRWGIYIYRYTVIIEVSHMYYVLICIR